MWGAWPLALASTPGGYLGAAVLLFVPFALRDAARRYLVVALGAVAVLAYLLTNTVLVGAGWFRSLALSLPFGDVYLHNPSRLRYLAFLIVPALGAVGIQWFLDHRPGFGEAMRWIGAGLVVFLVFPLVMGARPGRLVIFAVASVAVVGVVWAFARGRRWAPVALCAILAAELLTGAIWSSMYHGGTVYLGLETGSHAALVAAPLRWPDVDVHEYLSPGPIARTLQRSGPSDGRYLAWIRPDAYFNKGYLFTRKESDWPALLIGRSVLFQIPDTLGYSPVQLPGYWAYVHATNKLPLFYNAAAIQVPTLTDLRLLGARYLIVPQGISAPAAPGRVGTHRRDRGRLPPRRDRRRRAARLRGSDVDGGERRPGRARRRPRAGVRSGGARGARDRPRLDPERDRRCGDRRLPRGGAGGRADRGGGLGPVDPGRPQRVGRGLVGHGRRTVGARAPHRPVPPGGRAPGRPPRRPAHVPGAGDRDRARAVGDRLARVRRGAGVRDRRAASSGSGVSPAENRRRASRSPTCPTDDGSGSTHDRQLVRRELSAGGRARDPGRSTRPSARPRLRAAFGPSVDGDGCDVG